MASLPATDSQQSTNHSDMHAPAMHEHNVTTFPGDPLASKLRSSNVLRHSTAGEYTATITDAYSRMDNIA